MPTDIGVWKVFAKFQISATCTLLVIAGFSYSVVYIVVDVDRLIGCS